MGSHKTKNQLEIELNELKQLYGEKCSECDFLTKDNRAKSEAVTNACADLKNLRKDLEDARAELQTKEVCNKKLADQFYDYRNELVKVRKDLAEAIEKRDSLKVELEGVRGALKRESELREHAENENKMLRNERNEVEKIQRKHNKLTLEDLDNALRHWNYTDNKLSHDLCMPLESLIQLLDEYGVNDFCKLRERLMYGPAACYNSLHTRRLEKENKDLKAVADDLEQQLRRQTDNCKYWTDRAFRDEEELKKSMEHDRIAQENFEKAARKNDELQNEVNKLYQRWTDTFNPEDELLGRKVLEWQDINVVLAKHNIENSMVLGAELDMLKEYRKVLDKHSSATHGAIGAGLLDKLLSDRETDVFGYPVADWKRVLDENSVDCPGKLAAFLEGFEKYRRVVRNHGITNGQPGLDERLEKLEGLDKVCKEHDIESWFDLQKRLDEIEGLRRQSCPEEYMKVFSEYGIDSAEKLDESLERLERFQQMLRDWHFRTIDEFSTYVNRLHNYKIICEQNLISSTEELKKSFDELKAFRLKPFRGLGKEWRDVVDKHNVESAEKLDARLSCSCPEEYMKVFSKYGIDSAEKLDATLEKWFKVRQCSILLKNNIPYFGSIADFIRELA